MKSQMKVLKAIEVQLNEMPVKQTPLIDPVARSMKTRGAGIADYNVQTAVDAKHHLIVAGKVTNIGIDPVQLTSMDRQARAVIRYQRKACVH